MPEGPEVALFNRTLSRFTGRPLEMQVLSGRYAKQGKTPPWAGQPLGRFESSRCHGKRIFVFLRGVPDLGLVITFGMTGRFSETREPNARVKFDFGGAVLYYVDHRNFGSIRQHTRADLELIYDKLVITTPCAMTSPELFIHSALANARSSEAQRPICGVLLDQSIVGGVGNYLRAEILYAARIHPLTRMADLSDADLEVVARLISAKCAEFFRLKGTTLSTFSGVDGEPGAGQSALVCYKKKNDPSGNSIESFEDPDTRRTMWFCPAVQQAKAASLASESPSSP